MIPFAQLIVPQTQAQVFNTLTNIGASLGFPVTSWQPGQPGREVLWTVSQVLANFSALITVPIQGGFLDYAAQTSVTPEGGPGWLDALGSSVYNAPRLAATYAACNVTVSNSSGSTYSPAAGGFRVAQGSGTLATYSSTAAATIAAANTQNILSSTNASPIVLAFSSPHGMSAGDVVTVKNHLINTNANGTWTITVPDSTHIGLTGSTGNGVGGNTGTATDPVKTTIPIQADVAGSAASAGVGAINVINTPLAGVTISTNTVAVGTDAEKNAAYASRCRAKLSTLSTGGPGGAYDYYARTVNGTGTPVLVQSGALTAPAAPATKTSVTTNKSTGAVTTYVASSSGVYATPPNYTNQLSQAITSTTNAAPIVVNIPAHGYVTGDQIYISGAQDPNANGSWVGITRVDANNFSLPGSTGTLAGGAQGTAYRYSDLDLIDKSIQSNAVPNAVTATTVSCTSATMNITYTCYVPAANGGAVATAVANALAAYFAAFPLGGVKTSVPNQFPFDNIVGVIKGALPTATSSLTAVTVNGGTADVTMLVSDVAVQGTVTPTVNTF